MFSILRAFFRKSEQARPQEPFTPETGADLVPRPIVLKIFFQDEEVAFFSKEEVPAQKTVSRRLRPEKPPHLRVALSDGSELTFDCTPSLPETLPWVHFCFRLTELFISMNDCVFSATEALPPNDGLPQGIRFQPRLLPEFPDAPPDLRGAGAIARGLHYPAFVTPGTVRLIALCDECRKSFPLASFHGGFSDRELWYCGSGRHALSYTRGHPPEGPVPCQDCGTTFSATNPFRCPHCSAVFTRFDSPRCRDDEYYCCYHPGAKPRDYESPAERTGPA